MGMAAAGPGAARDRAGQIITAGLIGGVAGAALADELDGVDPGAHETAVR